MHQRRNISAVSSQNNRHAGALRQLSHISTRMNPIRVNPIRMGDKG